MAPRKKATELTVTPKAATQGVVLPPETPAYSLEYPKVESELLRPLRVLLHPNRQGQCFGLMCVRVDAADAVEALLGPAGLKEILAEAYARLRRCVRTTDLVAGGEGGLFFILATDLQSEDELEIISSRIQRTCRQPYWIGEQEIRSNLTTGGVGGSEGEGDPATLTQHAVLAMRRASSRGVAFDFFTTPGAAAAQLESGESAQALDDPFELNFIPQFAHDGVLTGTRVIARMAPLKGKSKGKSTVAKAAERQRNERIGDRVLRKLLERAQAWTQAGLTVPVLSIEIGATHLLTPGFADSLIKLLADTGTPGSSLDLLLTEATTLTSLGPAQKTLAVLAAAGVRFGLSGFSLNAGTRLDLRKLPFSSLRVSCASLFKATSDTESLWLSRSIVGVAHRCGLTVVGEDIENKSQKDILLQSGCDRFEGTFISPTLGSSAMETLLRDGSPAPKA